MLKNRTRPTLVVISCLVVYICKLHHEVLVLTSTESQITYLKLLEHQQVREKAYQDGKARRFDNALRLNARSFPEMIAHNTKISESKEPICVPRDWHRDLPWPWFVYAPTWTCANQMRIGELFDGGKWHCNLGILAAKSEQAGCIAYSFGSNGIIQYETMLHGHTGCEVHIFDPTVSDDRIPVMPKGLHFHKIGISAKSSTITVGDSKFDAKPLSTIMRELGHTHLNVLKIDIDGYEFDVVDALATDVLHVEDVHQGSYPTFQKHVLKDMVDELLLEVHWKGLDSVTKLFDTILAANFRIFKNEPNLFYIEQPSAGIEYSFVHERVAHEYETPWLA